MQSITDRLSNPFGMRPPCECQCSEGVPAVFGYGNPNAEFHLIGDHPGRHGGQTTGVPFTDNDGGERLLSVLDEVGMIDFSESLPVGDTLFMSYLHLCCSEDESDPTDADYQEFERFFDAELRAVTAHVLLPVGDRPIRHVLEHYTSIAVGSVDIESVHAKDLSGRGFLIIPISEPADWDDTDEDALKQTLERILASDYSQEADLTRFFPTNRQYLVR